MGISYPLDSWIKCWYINSPNCSLYPIRCKKTTNLCQLTSFRVWHRVRYYPRYADSSSNVLPQSIRATRLQYEEFIIILNLLKKTANCHWLARWEPNQIALKMGIRSMHWQTSIWISDTIYCWSLVPEYKIIQLQ